MKSKFVKQQMTNSKPITVMITLGSRMITQQITQN